MQLLLLNIYNLYFNHKNFYQFKICLSYINDVYKPNIIQLNKLSGFFFKY